MAYLPARFRSAARPDEAPAGGGAWQAFLIVLVLVLGATNVLTLIDDDFHTKAYKVVETIGRTLFNKPTFENSPTEVRKREGQEITQQLAAQTRTTKELATHILTLAANTSALVVSTKALVVEHTALQQSHRALADTSKAVSRRVAIRAASGAKRSVATMAGKAIPYAGVALLWVITGLEVADTCETLKDLNQLAKEAGDDQTSDESAICGLSVPTVAQVTASVTESAKDVYRAAVDVLPTKEQAKIPGNLLSTTKAQAQNLVCKVFGC